MVFVLRPSQLAAEVRLEFPSGGSLAFLPAMMPGVAVAGPVAARKASDWLLAPVGNHASIPHDVEVEVYRNSQDEQFGSYSTLSEALNRLYEGTSSGERAALELLQNRLDHGGIKTDSDRHLAYALAKAYGDAGKPELAADLLNSIEARWPDSNLTFIHLAGVARARQAAEEYAAVIELLSPTVARYCADQQFVSEYELDCAKIMLMLAGANLMHASRGQQKELVHLANESLEKLLKTTTLRKSRTLTADTYSLLALAALISGSFSEANTYYQLAMVEFKSNLTTHLDQIRSNRVNRASVLNRLGKVSEAQRILREVLADSSEQMTAESQLGILFNLALTYEETGDWIQSYRYFKQSHDLAERIGDRFSTHLSGFRAASSLRESGDATGALAIHTSALKFFETESPELANRLRVEIARDYLDLGDLLSAQRMISEAMSVSDKIVSTRYRLDALATATEVAWLSADFEKMARYEQKFDSEFREADLLPGVKIDLYLLFLRHSKALGDKAKASEYAKEALDLMESVRRQFTAPAIPKSWAHRTHDLVSENLRRLFHVTCSHTTRCREEAFEMLERHENYWVRAGRRTRLNESLSDANSVEPALRAYRTAEANLVDAARKPEQLAVAMEQLDLARERYLDSRSNLALPEEITTLTFDEIQASLQPDTLVIRFHYDDSTETITAFAVGATQFQSHELSAPDLPRLLNQFALDRGADSHVAGQLYTTLFGNLGSVNWVEIDRLVFVLPALMASTPLAALPIPGSQEHLATRFQIIQTPSVSDFLNERVQPTPSANVADIAIFADPIFGEMIAAQTETEAFRSWSQNLKRLPFTAREAESIQRRFTNRNVVLAARRAATANNLLSEPFRNASVLHIATHGYFSEKTPDVVGLAVSPSNEVGDRGFVSLSQFLAKDIKSRLVIISGCETALGKQYNGAGLESLTSGLLSRGAGSVIGTLWPVDDRGTATFMSHFYAGLDLHDGNGAMALRSAQRAMVDSRRYRHPKYWSGFVMVASNQSYTRVL